MANALVNTEIFKAGDWVEVIEVENIDKEYIRLGDVYRISDTITTDLVALEVEGLPDYLGNSYQVYKRQIRHEEKDIPKTSRSPKLLSDEPEMVNHPAHYEREGRLETIDYMEFVFGTKYTAIYCMVTSFKYRDRALLKGNEQQDYKKCDWYMNKYKELESKLGTDQEIANSMEL